MPTLATVQISMNSNGARLGAVRVSKRPSTRSSFFSVARSISTTRCPAIAHPAHARAEPRIGQQLSPRDGNIGRLRPMSQRSCSPKRDSTRERGNHGNCSVCQLSGRCQETWELSRSGPDSIVPRFPTVLSSAGWSVGRQRTISRLANRRGRTLIFLISHGGRSNAIGKEGPACCARRTRGVDLGSVRFRRHCASVKGEPKRPR